MTSVQVFDENYIRIGQIYQILKGKNRYKKSLETISLKAIIDNGFDVNYKLPYNSFICKKKPEYIGNTVLHLITEFYIESLESCFDLLIQCGADFTCKNDNGYTPLLLAFSKGFIVNSLLNAHIDKNNSTNPQCKNGISHFHVACSTNQIKIVDFFLKNSVSINERVNDDSPIFAGYTSLHFAMDNLQLETIELLLDNGANSNIKDAQGLTPLHLVIDKLSKSNFMDNLQIKDFLVKAIESTQLLNLLHKECLCFMHILWVLKHDHVQIEPNVINSTTCQGYSPLYFELLFNNNIDAIIQYLEQGANLLSKAENGLTLFDLCLKKYNLSHVNRILSAEKQLSQLKFTNGTLLLDLLSIIQKQDEFEEFLNSKASNVKTSIPFDAPIFAGYNLLHITVLFNGLTKMLLFYNADCTVPNTDGNSPLHLAFCLKQVDTVRMILNFHQNMPVNSINRDNFSHLHISCVMNNHRVVKLLLGNGANPNLAIQSDYQWKFDAQYTPDLNKIRKGSTALHIAVNMMEYELATTLLCSGANSNLPDADGVTPFQIILNHYNSSSYNKPVWNLVQQRIKPLFDRMLKINIEALVLTDTGVQTFYDALLRSNEPTLLQKLVHELEREKRYEKLGLTKLQLACVVGNSLLVKEELERGVNVNKRIKSDSPIWPGNTSLHILILKNRMSDNITKLLLKHEADPTLQNANNLTPIHLSKDNDLNKGFYLSKDKNLNKAVLLLKNKFTKVNPVNNEGLSHFHLCCKAKNLSIVQEFLTSGVDINAPVDYFADCFAGYTPLHFAVEFSSLEIIELLVRHGADYSIKDAHGFAPLHLAVFLGRFENDFLNALLRCPAVDVQITNIFGETAVELLLELGFYGHAVYHLLNHGCSLNFAKLTAKKLDKSTLIAKAACVLGKESFEKLIDNMPDLTCCDDEGQTIIHHVISVKQNISLPRYKNNVNILILKGCEINHKDIRGQTALHHATSLGIREVVQALLLLGADLNIMDDTRKTPYNNMNWSMVEDSIISDVIYLQEAKRYFKNLEKMDIMSEKIQLQLEIKEKLSTNFSVKYFFSQQFIVDYRRMPVLQRLVIRDICESIELFRQYPTLESLIRLQFRKARARTRLLEPAADALKMITNVVLPEPCSESIFKYLENNDLMNMLRTTNRKLEFGSLPENC